MKPIRLVGLLSSAAVAVLILALIWPGQDGLATAAQPAVRGRPSPAPQ